MSIAKVVVTGADGFIGRNLTVALGEGRRFDVRPICRGATEAERIQALADADAVVHLAGVNRPVDPTDFWTGNRGSVVDLVAAMNSIGRAVPVILASSIRSGDESVYGQSKKAAEDALIEFADRAAVAVQVLRLPNVFGKWCRPNYNSAVATFCHNLARGLPITIHDPAAPLSLVYIDDVTAAIADLLAAAPNASGWPEVRPVYETTVGEVAAFIDGFARGRAEMLVEPVGAGLERALYATFISSLPPEAFSYPLVAHVDQRGAFSEMLKTRASGQVSYFTAHPGVTRGGHYHHSKVEKFLVVAGEARFRFRHILSGETREIFTSGASPRVVETIPGWTHDITNVGTETLISMLWANEIFDPERPDTVAMPV